MTIMKGMGHFPMVENYPGFRPFLLPELETMARPFIARTFDVFAPLVSVKMEKEGYWMGLSALEMAAAFRDATKRKGPSTDKKTSPVAKKKVVTRAREGRAWRYRPAASRESYVSELMFDALGQTGDRDAALAAFVARRPAKSSDTSPNRYSATAGVLARRSNARTRARSSATAKGLLRWSSAPASRHSTRAATVFWAVSIRIGTSRPDLRSSRHSCRPETSGNPRSRMMRAMG